MSDMAYQEVEGEIRGPPEVPNLNLESVTGSRGNSVQKSKNNSMPIKNKNKDVETPYDDLISDQYRYGDEDEGEYDETLNRSQFEKAMQLENELRTAQKNYDKIVAEVTALSKVLRVKEATEAKMQIHLEDERLQVRRTESSLRKTQQELEKLEDEYKNCLSRETTSLQNIVQELKYIPPEDQLDILIKLENRDERGAKKIESTKRLLRELKTESAAKDKHIENISKELNAAERYSKDYEMQCENTRLKKEIHDLNDELVMLQQFTRTKTTQLEELNNTLNSFASLEISHERLKKKILLYNAEIEGHQFELDVVKREMTRNLDSIHELKQRKPLDRAELRQLENQKRRQYALLKKNKTKLGQLEKSTSFHQKELSDLYGRLSKLNTALSTLEDFESLEQSEMIPIEQFITVCKATEKERQREIALNKEIDELDVEIERLEYKTAILDKSKASSAKKKSQKIISLNKDIASIKGEIEDIDENHDVTMAELQNQLEELEIMYENHREVLAQQKEAAKDRRSDVVKKPEYINE
mmetsp:Transcript_913/g.1437  ORF Transcript_913/g.1437 Transcript_913/m.1437 type:complete len:530 (+) Transcript_913:244-1833(+)|eukprot:CAMPEP_0117423354 /NCGR_PEP_ID=MMETSP0758-20121206/3995_1 /TAXON_ID=63605 /ORGANISM="Percolomonas cosmopolitus, Strain AE-1 (ATCC 50343)" /LENGTH=529 /DNA_ID=CAMNT_0005206493 /DNA_START=130 /DNA_END=1719 /DNA_ORIENTATION=+